MAHAMWRRLQFVPISQTAAGLASMMLMSLGVNRQGMLVALRPGPITYFPETHQLCRLSGFNHDRCTRRVCTGGWVWAREADGTLRGQSSVLVCMGSDDLKLGSAGQTIERLRRSMSRNPWMRTLAID